MTSTYPTTPKGHRTRSHILAAATEAFVRDGYVAATMADIAEGSGVSMGGLYRYFGSKDELFSVLAADHIGLFLRGLDGAWDDLSIRPVPGLAAVNRTLVRFWVQHAGLSRVLEEAAAVAPQHRTELEAAHTRAVEGISRRLSAAGLAPGPRSTSRLVDLLIDTTRRAARQVADDPTLSEGKTVDLLVDIWSAALLESETVGSA